MFKLKKTRLLILLRLHGFIKTGGIYHRQGINHSSSIRFSGNQLIGKIYFNGESESDAIPLSESVAEIKRFIRMHCW